MDGKVHSNHLDRCTKCTYSKQINLLDNNTWDQLLCQCLPDINMDLPTQPSQQCTRSGCDNRGKQWAQCQECMCGVHTRCMNYEEYQTYRDGVFNCQSCRLGSSEQKQNFPVTPKSELPLQSDSMCSTQGLRGPDRTVLLPTFAGNETEDPRVFLSVCESKLSRHRVHRDDWTEVTANRLRGAAATWWNLAREYQVTWETFCTKLRHRFETSTDHIRNSASLYHEQQKEKEGIEEFTQRKAALFKRVYPDKPVEHVLEIVVTLASPAIRPHLRTIPRHAIEHFIREACEYERDVNTTVNRRASASANASTTADSMHQQNRRLTAPPVMQRQQQPPIMQKQQQTQSRAPPQQPRDSNRRTPSDPCRYCPDKQYHWHNECPNNPHIRQGN